MKWYVVWWKLIYIRWDPPPQKKGTFHQSPPTFENGIALICKVNGLHSKLTASFMYV